MKVGTKIGLAVGVMGAAALTFAASCFIAIQYLGGQAIMIYDGPMTSISYARSAETNALHASYEVNRSAWSESGFDAEGLEIALDDLVTDLEVVAERTQSPQTRELLDEILPMSRDALDQALVALEAGEALPEGFAGMLAQMSGMIASMVDFEAEYGYLFRQQVVDQTSEVLVAASTFIAISLLFSGVFAWFTASRIARRLRRINATMRDVADGELTTDVPFTGDKDEIGGVARAAEIFRKVLAQQVELEDRAHRERKAAEDARAAAEARSMDAQTARAEAEIARTEAETSRNYHAKKSAVADAFFVAFSRVVENAEQGVFDQRVGIRFDDEDYDSLSSAANRMMESIEFGVWETSQVVGDLAAGRLRTRMRGEYNGAFATLQRDVNATADRLREVVDQISGSSASISSEVRSLSQSSDSLAERSRSQAAALEDTNSSITQITETISNNVAGLQKVAVDANYAAVRATTGQKVVSDAIDAVKEIEDSAKKVSKIVDVIDDISFQTNLLALNAGVEAARAGEAGRGFAVVAHEVRQLAQRASDAAKGIGNLIEQSTRDVDKGAKLVKEAGDMLDEIVDAISEVESATEEISASSRAQADSMTNVSGAMKGMDLTTRDNAIAAEQTAGVVIQLNGETSRLEDLIGFFRDEKGKLKEGRNLDVKKRQSDWVEGQSENHRTEPYVGASIPAASSDHHSLPADVQIRA